MGKKIKILSIDGGGTRGLMPSTLLNCLENETGKPVTELFDVIVGSATGGIIAAALAGGLSTFEIIDIYLNQASYILPQSTFRRIWNPVNLFAPKYPNTNLKHLLEEKLGPSTTLKDVHDRYQNRPIFLIASLDMSPTLAAGEPPSFKIVIFNSVNATQQSERLVDVAMRTSAAAVNLPLYQHYGEGGNYANDPALIGLSFCLNAKKGCSDESFLPNNQLGLGVDPNDIKLFSIGCGMDGGSFISKEKIKDGKWGLIKWMGHLVNLVIDTNMVYSQYLLSEMLDEQRYLRINPYYKSDDAPAVLKNGKLRIDVHEKKQLEAIKSYGEYTFDREKKRIMNFLDL